MSNEIKEYERGKVNRKIGFWSVLIFTTVLLAGLALLAYLGYYNRYWADDYCYNRDFDNLGVIKTIGTYFEQGQEAKRGYSTNRYSLTLISGIFYQAGLSGTQIQASVIILSWLACLYWAGRNIFKSGIPKGILFLGCAFLLYFTLIFSPHRFQVLYWQAGVHYSYTLILGCLLVSLIFMKKENNAHFALINGLSTVIGFIAGGLSETACAYLIGVFGLLVIGAWLGKKKDQPWADQAFQTGVFALVGLLASFAVLVLSPSNARYEDMRSNHPPSIASLPLLAARFAAFFITDSLRSLPAPHLVLIAFFMALPILSSALQKDFINGSLRESLSWITVTIIVTFTLIVAIQAPTAYFYSSQAAPRTQSLSRFTMFLGLAIIAWNTVRAISSRIQPAALIWVALVILLLSSIYTIEHIITNYQELPGYIQRASAWDLRDEFIKEARSKGLVRIEISAIDTSVINVRDIVRSKRMDDWSSNCGSEYYGVEALYAVHP
jgi:hypothetical protein